MGAVGRIGAVLALAASLSGCASQQGLAPEAPDLYLAAYDLIDKPQPASFSFCLDHGCLKRSTTALGPAEWRRIVGSLTMRANSPEAERTELAAAVGRFERAARRSLGVKGDMAGTYPGAFASDQNDCVDETANTTTLLLMLQREGALAHHRVGRPARRGVFFNNALPHRSATLRETHSGARYAVDSWFRPSGAPADVAPLEEWLQGWRPPGGAKN